MSIEIIRSKRKSISLEVQKNGHVLVRAPLRMSQDRIEEFITKHEKWIASKTELVKLREENHPELSTEEMEALRCKAKEMLPFKVQYYAERMGVTPTSLKITSAHTRFGSCSGKNGICFSLYLMQYPEEAIDYVVVHELAHIKEHNHGPRFYQIIEEVLPDYRERKKLLKE